MQHTLHMTKTYLGHVPTAQAADYEHLLSRVGGRCNSVHINTNDINGEPNLFIRVSNISSTRPYELQLTFTNANYVHLDVATTRDGMAMFFGLADLLLKLNVDIWQNMTPRDLRTFADGLEIT